MQRKHPTTPDLFSTSERTPAAIELPVEEHAEQAYLRYAMSVIRDRALPAVADGQKPSQRRILYAMHMLGVKANSKPVKSARIVGEVIGKFHPHGDTAAYDTMVRMAQDFVARYPLVDGQGNFGSRDGASPAAQRYTESRLTPIADLLLRELGTGSVEFKANYDGTLTEPAVLPARLPMLLLNGASGIAVGMATEIPSHNLTEVAQALALLLTRPNADLAEVTAVLPGPDFPGGGQIVSSPAEIQAVYRSGKGSLRVRARWVVEKLARGDWRIVVNELPPGASAQAVLMEIDNLTNPRLKAGQKKPTAKQAADRQAMLGLLDKVRDEAGREHAVRLVIEPRSNRQDPDSLMAALLAQTSLEVKVPVNLVVLGLDGAPQATNLLEILREFLTFRQTTVLRRTRHRLEQISDRTEILQGRLLCLIDLDAVLAIIREAEDPAAQLMARFGLSARQAQDILDIRLRQLSRLEKLAVERELAELQKERGDLQQLLDDPAALRKCLLSEIRADAKDFGDARRTLIESTALVADSRAAAGAGSGPAAEYVLRLSMNGWVRLSRSADSPPDFRTGDVLRRELLVRTNQPVQFITDRGRVYSVTGEDLLAAGALKAAIPLAALRDLAGSAVDMITGEADAYIVIAQTAGYGFKCKLGDLTTRLRAGKAFVTLEVGSELLPTRVLPDDTTGYIAAWTDRKCLLFPVSELKYLPGGGKGVQLMALGQAKALLGTGYAANEENLPDGCPAGVPGAVVKPERLLGSRAGAGGAYRSQKTG